MSKWIKCSERMPEYNMPVWTWDGKAIRQMEFATWYDSGDKEAWCHSFARYVNGKWLSDDAEFDDDYAVTHWQALPEPPTEDELDGQVVWRQNRR